MQVSLFARMDDPQLFLEFKIILMRENKTVQQICNKFVEDYVKRNNKKISKRGVND